MGRSAGRRMGDVDGSVERECGVNDADEEEEKREVRSRGAGRGGSVWFWRGLVWRVKERK